MELWNGFDLYKRIGIQEALNKYKKRYLYKPSGYISNLAKKIHIQLMRNVLISYYNISEEELSDIENKMKG